MIKVAITSFKNNNKKIINEKLKQTLEISQRAVSHGTSVFYLKDNDTFLIFIDIQ